MSLLSVNTNLAALRVQRQLQASVGNMSTALQRLSSGLRINTARDDAAGMTIATRMSAQIRGLDQGIRNVADGISLAQTAEGGLESVAANLQRIRELAVQAANFTNSPSDRAVLQLEVAQPRQEITRVGKQTSFNGVKLLNGGFGAATFQTGADPGESITISSLIDVRAIALGFGDQPKDARLLAEAINLLASQYIPGLSAVAAPNTQTGATTGASAAVSHTFSLNGHMIVVHATGGVQADWLHAIDVINAASGDTGIFAEDADSGIRLGQPQGGNILLEEHEPNTAGFYGLQGLVSDYGLASSIAVTYSGPRSTVDLQLVFTNTGMETEVFDIPAYVSLESIDLSTVSGANMAIFVSDAAIDAVNRARASLGAAMNRFEAAIVSQRIGAESQTASRSRIQDADFASETAALARTQILQRSGQAMLVQENAAPTNVLNLLK